MSTTRRSKQACRPLRTPVTGADVIRLFASGNDPQPRGHEVVVEAVVEVVVEAVETVRGAEVEPTRVGAAIAAAGIAVMATAARIVLRVMWWMFMMCSPLVRTLTWTEARNGWLTVNPGDFRYPIGHDVQMTPDELLDVF